MFLFIEKPYNMISKIKGKLIFGLLMFLLFIICLMMPNSAWCQDKVIKILTLQDSIQIAMENNLMIKNAHEKVKSAELKVNEARASMMPSISATGSYTYMGEIPTIEFNLDPSALGLPAGIPGMGSGGKNEIPMGYEDTYSAGLSAQQPIFTWWKLSNNYKQAKLSLEAAKQELEATRQQITFDMTSAFYGALLVEKMVKVADMAVDQVQAHVKIAQDLVNAGMATNFDLLRAKVQLANIKSQAIKARNGLKLSRDAFKNVAGMDLSTEIELKGEMEYRPIDLELSKLIETAMANRSELKQMAYQEKALEYIVKIAKGGNKPNASLIGNYSYQSNADSLGDIFKGDEWKNTWSITLGLQIPIFDGLATRARVKQAESGLRQLQNGIELLKGGIELDVRASFLSFQEAKELLKAQEEAVQQAEESLRIAKLQYENGMITSIELMDAELALTQAQTNDYNALHDYIIAIAKLEKATASKIN